ncbi:MAG: glycosyltransferase family 2 protein [Candidatus Eremiobacteraeota bacterium]|nr:glycosyltransferase family 2 protein [Candidatus Eremiobacteraeota bacterium]MBC5828270.1 glycosyltransferase family 2 protein [Candidatus Eremiobacteraeota bacterium]
MRAAEVTFVVLTRNEATRIRACLESIPPGAPVLIYDAESTDGTRDLARAFGADVVVAPWRGFVEARRRAAALVRTAWTFMLDADEAITPELAAELSALEAAAPVEAFSVARRNVFCGRWIRGAGWWPDRLLRLFRTGRASLSARPGALHEVWRVSGRCGLLRSPVEHRSYRSLSEYGEKFHRYTSSEAAAAPSSLGGAIIGWAVAPARAFWLLAVRGGARDGWRGVFIAFASAAYPAVVATKALLRRREN